MGDTRGITFRGDRPTLGHPRLSNDARWRRQSCRFTVRTWAGRLYRTASGHSRHLLAPPVRPREDTVAKHAALISAGSHNRSEARTVWRLCELAVFVDYRGCPDSRPPPTVALIGDALQRSATNKHSSSSGLSIRRWVRASPNKGAVGGRLGRLPPPNFRISRRPGLWPRQDDGESRK